MAAPDRANDSKRVFPISNVNVLRNLSATGTTTSPGFKGSRLTLNPSLGSGEASLNKQLKEGKPEVTARMGRSVKKATGETTSEARQKAYNAASTEHTENLKSGKFYQQELAADTISRFPSKGEPIKINTDPAKGK